MSSSKERRKQKTPNGGYPRKEAVNPPEAVEAPSSLPARPAGRPCEEASHLLEKVLERDNMLQALRRVESNKGAPGIDGMDAKSLRHYLVEHWPRIKEELLQGTYQPSPVRRVEIPKPDGGVRLLGIPTVTDRMIQQAILQVLTPIFDPGFSDSSFGFRPGRSAHQAVKQARGYIEAGYQFTVDLDLEKFFGAPG